MVIIHTRIHYLPIPKFLNRNSFIVLSDPSKMTLFSGSLSRDSVDTWFEVDLPFQIEPDKACLNPNESQIFKVTFSPQDAFLFKVRLQSTIGKYHKFHGIIHSKVLMYNIEFRFTDLKFQII